MIEGDLIGGGVNVCLEGIGNYIGLFMNFFLHEVTEATFPDEIAIDLGEFDFAIGRSILAIINTGIATA